MEAVSLSIRRTWTWAVGLPYPVILFLVAAALRLLAFAAFYFGSVLTGHHGVVDPFDSVGIDRWAWYAAQQLRVGSWVDLRAYNLEGSWDVGFTYLVASEYLVVGHHPEIARAINCLVAAFCAPAAYLAASGTAVGQTVARRAGWLVACWPLSIYWAGYDLLKDPLVWFFLAVAIIALTAGTWRSSAWLGAVATGGTQLVRGFMGPIVGALLVLGAVLKRDWRGLVAILVALALVEVALPLAGYPAAWSMDQYRGNGQAVTGGTPGASGSLQAAVGGDPATQAATASIAGNGTDALSLLKSLSNPKAFAARMLVGTATVLLGPRLALKDILHPTLDSGMFPGMVVWIALIPFTALGLWRAARRPDPRLWSLGLFVVTIWAALALLYAGQAFRQREMVFPATLVFTALGLERPLPRRWWWTYSIFWALGLVTLIARETGLV